MTATLSCLTVLGSASGQATIRWDNGTSSRYSFSRSTQTVLGQLVTTATGTVVVGEFLGRSVLIVLVSPTLNALDCLSWRGLTHRSGTSTLTIR